MHVHQIALWSLCWGRGFARNKAFFLNFSPLFHYHYGSGVCYHSPYLPQTFYFSTYFRSFFFETKNNLSTKKYYVESLLEKCDCGWRITWLIPIFSKNSSFSLRAGVRGAGPAAYQPATSRVFIEEFLFSRSYFMSEVNTFVTRPILQETQVQTENYVINIMQG